MAELAKKVKLLSIPSETFPCSLQELDWAVDVKVLSYVESKSYQKREKLMFLVARPGKVKYQITNRKSNNVFSGKK